MSRVATSLQSTPAPTVAHALHIAALAPNTRRSYHAQWRQWCDYARDAQVDILPARPAEVARWLAQRLGLGGTSSDDIGDHRTAQRLSAKSNEQAAVRRDLRVRQSHSARRQSAERIRSISLATTRTAIAAVRLAHLAQGLAFESSHPDLLLVLRAARSADSRRAVQAQPIKAKTMHALLKSLGETPRDCRDAVLLALGYGFARRRSELVGIDYLRPGTGTGYLTITPDALELRLTRTKSGQPQDFIMPRRANEAVVALIERWVEIAAIQPGEPLLRRVYRSGRIAAERLDAQSVALIVKSRMRALLEAGGASPTTAGRDAQSYKGHSLRVGFAVTAAEAGASVLAVQKALGHASPAMAARYAQSTELKRMSPHNLHGVALGGAVTGGDEPVRGITTPRALRRLIAKLPASGPISSRLDAALASPAVRSHRWYKTQKQHWQGWLDDYDGPGAYGRKTWDRTARFVYTHIGCPAMLLWLAEAAGVGRARVAAAAASALDAKGAYSTRCAAIRRQIPWDTIERLLLDATPTRHHHPRPPPPY